MTTIPASQLASVSPSVLGVGGSAVDVIALMLSQSTRTPIGTVNRFADQPSIASYYGPNSTEAALATTYFKGFTGSNKLPGSVLIAQYNQSAVGAYLRGGSLSALTLANLQALNGLLTIAVNGNLATGSVNLAGAASFSAAATLIETALNAGAAITAALAPNVGTGTIAPNSFTAAIAGTVMTVSAIATGAPAQGQTVSGVGVTLGTTIVQQLTGAAGGTGTYQVNIGQNVASTTITSSGGMLNLTALTTGTFRIGQTISGAGITAGTKITKYLTGTGGVGKYAVDISQTAASTTVTATGATLTVSAVASGVLSLTDVLVGAGVSANTAITEFLTGTGGIGTYMVNNAQTVASVAMAVAGAGVSVSYDSISAAFVVASTATGSTSTIDFATDALAAPLKMTSATGAVLSQGADAAAPASFMDGIIQVNSNWVTFMTMFDPDNGAGNTVKQAFAAWKNTQNNRFGYVCSDPDLSPTVSVPATASLGYLLSQNGDSGTALVWDPVGQDIAAFLCGSAASIDFTQRNGRTTFAFRRQDGLVADVVTATMGINLGGNPQTADRGNGYSFYGAYGAAAANFIWFQRGFVTGDFKWFDSYINQVWMNNNFQLALLNLQSNALSIPYTISGAALIEAALGDAIAAAGLFGAFAPGDISQSQIAAVNAAAGANVAPTLQTQGYYLQVLQASSASRVARTTPPCKFWYLDRGSVQAINLASVALQ